MAFDFETESEDFFGALKPLIPKAIDIAHLCFEQILVKENRIKAGEYDKKKGSQGIFVSSLKIRDERYGFNFEGVAFSSTPTIDELEEKIGEIQDLLLSLGVYNPAPFPDEDLQARIVIENMPFFSGVFSILLGAQRYSDEKYRGYIIVSYEDIISNLEEATHLIETAMKRSPTYYTAFVGYGQPDRGFAEKLVEDLKEKGVSCWLYSLDYTPGERTWREIAVKRRESEKMIVLCSSKSLVRDGLLKEVEEQIDEDPNKIIPISIDNLWKEKGFLVMRAERDLKPFLMDRNYADFSNELYYKDALARLIKALER
jgi:hypothetical protein